MQAKVINAGPERTIALIFDAGDEVIGNIERFAAERDLGASRFSALGAFERGTFGSPAYLRREHDPVSGLRLINIGESVE